MAYNFMTDYIDFVINYNGSCVTPPRPFLLIFVCLLLLINQFFRVAFILLYFHV